MVETRVHAFFLGNQWKKHTVVWGSFAASCILYSQIPGLPAWAFVTSVLVLTASLVLAYVAWFQMKTSSWAPIWATLPLALAVAYIFFAAFNSHLSLSSSLLMSFGPALASSIAIVLGWRQDRDVDAFMAWIQRHKTWLVMILLAHLVVGSLYEIQASAAAQKNDAQSEELIKNIAELKVLVESLTNKNDSLESQVSEYSLQIEWRRKAEAVILGVGTVMDTVAGSLQFIRHNNLDDLPSLAPEGVTAMLKALDTFHDAAVAAINTGANDAEGLGAVVSPEALSRVTDLLDEGFGRAGQLTLTYAETDSSDRARDALENSFEALEFVLMAGTEIIRIALSKPPK